MFSISHLVIEVENNRKLSVTVGVVPRFSLKLGLKQYFVLILLFSLKAWRRFIFSEFLTPSALSIFRKYMYFWQLHN